MIHTFAVKDFRSLEDVSIDFEPVTVLVGRSGSGKSNIVNALRFLRNYLLVEDQAIDGFGGEDGVLPISNPKPGLGFHATFSIQSVPERFEYVIAFEARGNNRHPVLHKESLAVGGRTLFHHEQNQWKVKPAGGPAQPTQLMIKRLPSMEEAVLAYRALTDGIGCYEFPSHVLTPVVESRALFAQAISQHLSGLHDNGGHYMTVLKDVTSNLHDLGPRRSILAALRHLNPTVHVVELDPIQNPQRVLVTHKFNGDTAAFDLSQESDGLRRFYAHLLALYQTPPKQTLVFEEPENGIYPGALELLAEEFHAAPAAQRGQVILTTHSPGLLDHFRPEQLRVVELQGRHTHVGHVAVEQVSAIRENLLLTGELLTVDEARLEESGATDS